MKLDWICEECNHEFKIVANSDIIHHCPSCEAEINQFAYMEALNELAELSYDEDALNVMRGAL
jgi:ribosomal protein L37AE/L43A